MSRLPDGFSHLEALVDAWVLPDSRARAEKRLATPFEEIRTFYDTMLAAAPAALEYLTERRLGELDDTEERLLKLLLALAEVGPAVEWYEQPAVREGWPAHRFPLVEQLADNEAQVRDQS